MSELKKVYAIAATLVKMQTEHMRKMRTDQTHWLSALRLVYLFVCWLVCEWFAFMCAHQLRYSTHRLTMWSNTYVFLSSMLPVHLLPCSCMHPSFASPSVRIICIIQKWNLYSLLSAFFFISSAFSPCSWNRWPLLFDSFIGRPTENCALASKCNWYFCDNAIVTQQSLDEWIFLNCLVHLFTVDNFARISNAWLVLPYYRVKYACSFVTFFYFAPQFSKESARNARMSVFVSVRVCMRAFGNVGMFHTYDSHTWTQTCTRTLPTKSTVKSETDKQCVCVLVAMYILNTLHICLDDPFGESTTLRRKKKTDIDEM